MSEKERLIKLLVDDFVKDFPDASRAEIMNLTLRLQGFDIPDLQLLVSQLK